MRWDLGCLLFDEAGDLAFGMLWAKYGGRRVTQRGVGRRIDVECAHAPATCKRGTTLACRHGVGDELQPAATGTGPLLQRDYWAVLGGCRLTPSEVMTHIKSRFCELPPAALIRFETTQGLAKDAEMQIHIRPAQQCRVRVVHVDAQSITLGTLAGHPEAGRITFGSYRNARGDVIFHIRSRARSATTATRIGFMAIGDAMQTNTWTDFINNTAASIGARIEGAIHAETQELGERDEAADSAASPTFLAVGD